MRAIVCLVGENQMCSTPRHCRNASVYGHTTTAMHGMSTHPPGLPPHEMMYTPSMESVPLTSHNLSPPPPPAPTYRLFQTMYMPSTEPVPSCPAYLLPSEDWEREVLSTFVDLRQVLNSLAVDQLLSISCCRLLFTGDPS